MLNHFSSATRVRHIDGTFYEPPSLCLRTFLVCDSEHCRKNSLKFQLVPETAQNKLLESLIKYNSQLFCSLFRFLIPDFFILTYLRISRVSVFCAAN